ncbi:MAG: hypothetical protein HS115_05555 [Spirochaetales bacterium]|nr:hypothetical protein [Spirochaetales bacterium]
MLDELDLSQKITREEYDRALPALQKELQLLSLQYHRKERSCLIVFEGMDAAGKGGAIRRLIGRLYPGVFSVYPFAAPLPEEKARHYLWRFARVLERGPVIHIFDRSWYGRVLVERVEGFASQAEWEMAYREINSFEKSFIQAGLPVIKFWLHIGLDEQLQRFTDREASPLKQWKLTAEDWRNREKWPAYKMAIDEMLLRTATPFAPWHVIEGNDKLFARIKILRIVTEELRRALKYKK